MILGGNPEEGFEFFGEDAPKVAAGDFETIKRPLDFCGVNLYSDISTVKAGAATVPQALPREANHPMTACHWAVTASILRRGRCSSRSATSCRSSSRKRVSNIDWVALDGRVWDPQRIDLIPRHWIEIEKAMVDGVNVLGYLCWSLLDHFEWNHGFLERFGWFMPISHRASGP